MRFGKLISESMVSEWSELYFNYRQGKKLLSRLMRLLTASPDDPHHQHHEEDEEDEEEDEEHSVRKNKHDLNKTGDENAKNAENTENTENAAGVGMEHANTNANSSGNTNENENENENANGTGLLTIFEHALESFDSFIKPKDGDDTEMEEKIHYHYPVQTQTNNLQSSHSNNNNNNQNNNNTSNDNTNQNNNNNNNNNNNTSNRCCPSLFNEFKTRIKSTTAVVIPITATQIKDNISQHLLRNDSKNQRVTFRQPSSTPFSQSDVNSTSAPHIQLQQQSQIISHDENKYDISGNTNNHSNNNSHNSINHNNIDHPTIADLPVDYAPAKYTDFLVDDKDTAIKQRAIRDAFNDFIHFLIGERNKIFEFYQKKADESRQSYQLLEHQLEKHQEAVLKNKFFKQNSVRNQNEKNLLKLARTDVVGFEHLANYQNLCYTGFRKILKKYDKIASSDEGIAAGLKLISKRFMTKLEKDEEFAKDKVGDELIEKTKRIFAAVLLNGNLHEAANLLVTFRNVRKYDWDSFRLGMFTGASLCLIIAIVILAQPHRKKPWLGIHPEWQMTLSGFRALGLPLLMVWGFAFDSVIWKQHGINYSFVLNISRNVIPAHIIMGYSGIATVTWLVGILLYVGSYEYGFVYFAKYLPPLTLLMIIVTLLLPYLPTIYRILQNSIFHSNSVEPRLVAVFYPYTIAPWLFRKLWKIITIPYYPIEFCDTFIADQLMSLNRMFQDIYRSSCYFHHDAPNFSPKNCYQVSKYSAGIFVIALVPAYWRLLQCLKRYYVTRQAVPHLLNAGKYFATLLSVIFSGLYSYSLETVDHISSRTRYGILIGWVFFSVISTLYSFMWDVHFDWGLLSYDKKTKKIKFIRKAHHLPEIFYYVAVFLDFFLRITWTITVSPSTNLYFANAFGDADYFSTIVSVLEVFRRSMWNLLRIEYEHSINAEKNKDINDSLIMPYLSSMKIN